MASPKISTVIFPKKIPGAQSDLRGLYCKTIPHIKKPKPVFYHPVCTVGTCISQVLPPLEARGLWRILPYQDPHAAGNFRRKFLPLPPVEEFHLTPKTH